MHFALVRPAIALHSQNITYSTVFKHTITIITAAGNSFITCSVMPARGDRKATTWSKDSGQRRPRDIGRGQWNRAQKEERANRVKRPRTDDGENGEENEEVDENGVVKKVKVETRKARPLAEGEEREERRPKKKVAVLLGYCGTGYKGMQLYVVVLKK